MSDKEFIWTDELVIEYGLQVKSKIDIEKDIEAFKKSKIYPPEFKILSFVNDFNYILSRRDDGYFRAESHHGGNTETLLLNSKVFHIRSIKRLSDNEEFELDEKFTANAGCDLTIKSFEISGNTINVWSKEYGYWQLSQIQKVKPKLPLFKDFFNNDIFDGEDIWQVSKVGNYYVHKVRARIEISNPPSYFVYFKDESAAREYALYNMPRLSLNDILSIWGTEPPDFYKQAPLFKQIEALAKSKINP